MVKHWRVNERRPRNNNTTKVNASETTTTMMMMIGRTWVVLLLLLSLVQVQSVRATSLEYAIAAKGIHTVHKANIFDHSKKKGESKKGRSKEGKGAISMPSLSPGKHKPKVDLVISDRGPWTYKHVTIYSSIFLLRLEE